MADQPPIQSFKEPEGPKLKRIREEAGLSQAEVARRMEVSQATVSRWEEANDPGEYWIGGEKREDGTRKPALCVVLGVYEAIPGAPFEPKQRRAYIEARNAKIPELNAAIERHRKARKKERA